MNKSNTVSNQDLADTRAVVVTHRTTGDTKLFYLKSDGSAVFSVNKRGKLIRHKLSACTRGDRFLNWNIATDQRKNNNECLYIHRLVWSSYYNEGIYVNAGDGMEIDHVDDDPTNNHPSNLQLITGADNARKAMAKRWHGKKLTFAYALLHSLEDAA